MNNTNRVDMHVHSIASQLSKLGVQRSLQLPECATPPEEVYELAKRRGMDFVTITDHDTIAGAQTIAHLPDVFVSEELTASFKAEPQAVHVLCYGITPDDHHWLQAHSDDLEACAEYLQAHEITAALAHPFYAVAAPLTAAHRRRLAELFPIWETRNGSRAKELNLPAFVYIDLLAVAFLAARRRDPRLHLVLAGGGPEEPDLRARLGSSASFLGWLEGEALARAYASADALLFASHTDTYGQVIVEAQASGLPVVAVAEGGPASLIEHGRTGLLASASADALADQLLRVVSEPLLRARLRRAARESVSGRTWPAALRQLADGYREVLKGTARRRGREAA